MTTVNSFLILLFILPLQSMSIKSNDMINDNIRGTQKCSAQKGHCTNYSFLVAEIKVRDVFKCAQAAYKGQPLGLELIDLDDRSTEFVHSLRIASLFSTRRENMIKEKYVDISNNKNPFNKSHYTPLNISSGRMKRDENCINTKNISSPHLDRLSPNSTNVSVDHNFAYDPNNPETLYKDEWQPANPTAGFGGSFAVEIPSDQVFTGILKIVTLRKNNKCFESFGEKFIIRFFLKENVHQSTTMRKRALSFTNPFNGELNPVHYIENPRDCKAPRFDSQSVTEAHEGYFLNFYWRDSHNNPRWDGPDYKLLNIIRENIGIETMKFFIPGRYKHNDCQVFHDVLQEMQRCGPIFSLNAFYLRKDIFEYADFITPVTQGKFCIIVREAESALYSKILMLPYHRATWAIFFVTILTVSLSWTVVNILSPKTCKRQRLNLPVNNDRELSYHIFSTNELNSSPNRQAQLSSKSYMQEMGSKCGQNEKYFDFPLASQDNKKIHGEPYLLNSTGDVTERYQKEFDQTQLDIYHNLISLSKPSPIHPITLPNRFRNLVNNIIKKVKHHSNFSQTLTSRTESPQKITTPQYIASPANDGLENPADFPRDNANNLEMKGYTLTVPANRMPQAEKSFSSTKEPWVTAIPLGTQELKDCKTGNTEVAQTYEQVQSDEPFLKQIVGLEDLFRDRGVGLGGYSYEQDVEMAESLYKRPIGLETLPCGQSVGLNEPFKGRRVAVDDTFYKQSVPLEETQPAITADRAILWMSGMAYALTDAAEVTLTGASGRRIRSNAQRVTLAALLLPVLVLAHAYQGQLLGFIARPPRNMDPNTLEEVAPMIRKLYISGSSRIDTSESENRPVLEELARKTVRLENIQSTMKALSDILAHGEDAILLTDQTFDYTTRLRSLQEGFSSTFHRVEDCLITPGFMAYIVRKGSVTTEWLNNIVQRVVEAGLYDHWTRMQRYLIDINRVTIPREIIKSKTPRPLRMEQLIGPFWLLIVGLILSTVSFLVSLLMYHVRGSPKNFEIS